MTLPEVSSDGLRCPHCDAELLPADTYVDIDAMAGRGMGALVEHYAAEHPDRNIALDLVESMKRAGS